VYILAYLGVIIDEQLNWREYIDHVYSKLIKFTGLFYKVRDLMSWKIVNMLYFAFIDSHILYTQSPEGVI